MDTLSQPLLNAEIDLQYLIIASLLTMELINSPPKTKNNYKNWTIFNISIKKKLKVTMKKNLH